MIAVVFIGGLVLKRLSNKQKYEYRMNPASPKVISKTKKNILNLKISLKYLSSFKTWTPYQLSKVADYWSMVGGHWYVIPITWATSSAICRCFSF
jgi:hypothetical protein